MSTPDQNRPDKPFISLIVPVFNEATSVRPFLAETGAVLDTSACAFEVIFINDGSGSFTFTPLPRIAQIAPSFGVLLADVDADGHIDCVLAQNTFSPQRETGRMDGGLGLLLKGNGTGEFQPVWPATSGISVPADAVGVAAPDLNRDGKQDVVFSTNDGRVYAFEKSDI